MTQTAQAPPVRSLRVLTIVLAAACGLSVANLYYAQPLLAQIARTFHTSQGTTAVVVTMTQLGYALGLIFVLPLGDLLENRKLTSRTLIGTAVALGLAAAAPNLGVFLVLSVFIGVTSVVAQILIPLAAHLAPEEQRGRFVGTVMSGLLLGILLARTLASLVASAWGWRSIFVISAVLMLALSVVLRLMLPERRPDHSAGYRSLLASVVTLAREEPLLRRRAAAQALLFGSFSAFWTSIAYELISAHHFSQNGIGIFALVGAAGAAAAPIAGKVADRGHGRLGRGIAILLGIASMAVAGFGASNVILLAAAGILLDLAVQGHQVLSQQEIYKLRPDARARTNTVYMGTIFLGGALASAISGVMHDKYGWTAVTIFAAALPAVALVIWAMPTDRARKTGAAS